MQCNVLNYYSDSSVQFQVYLGTIFMVAMSMFYHFILLTRVKVMKNKTNHVNCLVLLIFSGF